MVTGRAPGGKGRRALSPILFLLAPLVFFLYVLIFRINKAEHFAPQASYRKKRVGATIAYGFESLGPRARKAPASEQAENPRRRAA